MKNYCIKSIAVFIFSCIFLSNCKKNDDILVHVIKDEYTFEDQDEIGKTLKTLIVNSPDRYHILEQSENADFYKYVNTLMDMLANTDYVTNRVNFKWDVTIIQDDNVTTSFITPGGHLFIYTGLLKFINSETELFSILAHEVNYADSGNLMERLVSTFGKDVIGDLLLGYDIPTTRAVANSLENISYTEQEVLIADRYALNIICPFQYDAIGLKTFLERANSNSFEIQWLETHPSSITRIESIEEYAVNCGIEEDTFTQRYLEYKALLP